MSTTTTNFGITLPEGIDTFNPLTFNNDAFTLIDNQMFKNQQRGCTEATHILNEGVHTIVRKLPTTPLLVFIATADYSINDTFDVDGVNCQLRYANGRVPYSDAFKSNQAVLCYLNGSILNLISASNPTARDVNFNLEHTPNLHTPTVQGAIEEINSRVSVIKDDSSSFEIGNIRVCYGTATLNAVINPSCAEVTVSLPKPYVDNQYTCVATLSHNISYAKYFGVTTRVAVSQANSFSLRAMRSSGTFTADDLVSTPLTCKWITIGVIA